MKSTNYPMKGWHLEHAEKAIARYAMGLPVDASEYERRNYKKYGTIASCIRQIEYDMHHGVQKHEINKIIRKIRLTKKYAKIRSDPEAMKRLDELSDLLAGISKEEERLAWHQRAYKEKVKKVI
ncbi:MAG: hypothetical protein ACREAW_07890 [Nitrososphaera sp.]